MRCNHLLLLILLTSALPLHAADKRALAASIIDRAFEHSAVLHWAELPPSRISGEFRFLGKGAEGSGTFLRDLATPQLWRERIQAGEYLQFRVRKNDKLWSSETFEFMPIRVLQFTEAFHPRMHPLNKGDVVTEAFKKTVNGKDVECVNLMAFGDSEYRHEHHFFCIESATGALALFQTQEFAIAYSGYQKLGDWLIPTKIQIAEEGKPVAEGTVKIEPPPALDAADFVQLPNASEIPICTNLQEPYVRQDPQNWYTEAMRRTVHGRVTVWMKLDAKGRVTKTFVAEEGNKDMNALAVETVHRSILEPARCDGKAVPSTYHVTMFFEGSN